MSSMLRITTTAVCLLAASLLLCAGCDSIPDSVLDRIDGAEPPHVRIFAADQRTTYLGARAAIDQLGFRFVKGGPATGDLEALSVLVPGEAQGSTQQFSLKATFSPTPDGGTEVDVWLKEVIEGDTENRQGFATESPLRDTPLYETFFRAVQQGIGGGK
jgi:hypothetical protein